MSITGIEIITWVLALIFLGFGALVLWRLWKNPNSLDGLISEPGPSGTTKASLSRLQLLLFTFVISGLYLALSLEAGDLIKIDETALGLLGISGGSFLVSKGISSSGGSTQQHQNQDNPKQ